MQHLYYRIIVIDDEPWALSYMRKVFDRRDLGFAVCGAFSNAESAIRQLPTLSPHVIITDIQLPKITGLELLKILHNMVPECVVVIVSAYSDFSYAQEALRHHAFDYCVKPVNIQDAQLLLQRLAVHLQKRELFPIVLPSSDMPSQTAPSGNPIADSSFHELLVYVKTHFTDRLLLKDLAEQFSLTPNYCSSLFTKTTGMAFSQYLTRLRMEKASQLLENKDLTIREIAQLTGYDDLIYFSKVFKKYYSLTPSQYRESDHKEVSHE